MKIETNYKDIAEEGAIDALQNAIFEINKSQYVLNLFAFNTPYKKRVADKAKRELQICLNRMRVTYHMRIIKGCK